MFVDLRSRLEGVLGPEHWDWRCTCTSEGKRHTFSHAYTSFEVDPADVGCIYRMGQGYITREDTHGGAGSMMHSPLLFLNEDSVASYLGSVRGPRVCRHPMAWRHGVCLPRSSQNSSVTGDSSVP